MAAHFSLRLITKRPPWLVFTILSICRGGGYRYCRTDPPHPNRNAKGLYPLHRVLMENKLGRLLESAEHVHHKDEDKANDAPKNLELKTRSQHSRDHALSRAPKHIELKCACGRAFQLRPNVFRARTAQSLSGRLFCSRSCGATNFPGFAAGHM